MTNIPRRKIYETMLEFEDALIEMQILLFSQENYDKFKDKFNDKTYPEIKRTYFEIKALLVMFLENKHFEKEEDFRGELKYFIKNQKEVEAILKKDKNLKPQFKELYRKIEIELENGKVESLEEGKEFFAKLDDFNDQIPKILTIRRDRMK